MPSALSNFIIFGGIAAHMKAVWEWAALYRVRNKVHDKLLFQIASVAFEFCDGPAAVIGRSFGQPDVSCRLSQPTTANGRTASRFSRQLVGIDVSTAGVGMVDEENGVYIFVYTCPFIIGGLTTREKEVIYKKHGGDPKGTDQEENQIERGERTTRGGGTMEEADRLFWRFILHWILLSGVVLQATCLKVGINYGQIANNLPSPTRVADLLRSLNISRVKLYDADQNVLSAFLNTNVEFIVGIGNENLSNMMDATIAQAWLEQHVLPYIPSARITCITVGNEVFSGNDTTLMANLLPAMQSVHQALVSLGLDNQISVSTAHSLTVLGNSFPPSSGSFRSDLGEYIHGVLNFHSMTKSPFLINAYPYFAYKANPSSISLQYVLFEPNPGVIDPYTNLNYDNMLYAQVDAVYSAIKAMGHTDIDVRISETGWPSKGDPEEFGASPANAAAYNGNLLRRIAKNEGTPLMPSVPIDIYVFALFNENMKPGPTSERNYGLFYPDGSPVYNIGLQGRLPNSSISRRQHAISGLAVSLITAVVAYLLICIKMR
ncbi:hypothetical protein HPP92_008814 [Vanilla planifolia]|uniref:glucan endo-1,3-beta-D-glucosidase n=1 Tax=Vanilla planifolia TaxID=51239 RepID=A0A835RD36_VANPL|nr:hypothetical protein HPP92_008814 [Vanilla planifolia]